MIFFVVVSNLCLVEKVIILIFILGFVNFKNCFDFVLIFCIMMLYIWVKLVFLINLFVVFVVLYFFIVCKSDNGVLSKVKLVIKIFVCVFVFLLYVVKIFVEIFINLLK